MTRATFARSPFIAMSLRADEQFHTNFFGFLLESEDQQLEDLRRALSSAFEFASVVR